LAERQSCGVTRPIPFWDYLANGCFGRPSAISAASNVLFLLVGARSPALVAIPLIVGATAARLLHAYGMLHAQSVAAESAPRLAGAIGTYCFGLGLAVAAAASLL
jgi:hypothetical protein